MTNTLERGKMTRKGRTKKDMGKQTVRAKVSKKTTFGGELGSTIDHFVIRINKLINDLHKNGMETIIILVNKKDGTTHQRASEKGLQFLDKHSIQLDFMQFCSEENSKESCDQDTGNDPLENENQLEEIHTVGIAEKIVQENHIDSDDKDVDNFTDISNVDQITKNILKLDPARNKKQTLIQYLKAGLDVEKFNKVLNCQDTEDEQDDIIRRLAEFHNMSSKPMGYTNKSGYTCDLCNLKLKKTQLKDHLHLHKQILDGVIETCRDCKLSLPEQYLLKHNCVKIKPKLLPKHISPLERDLRHDIAIIETKYPWQDFTSIVKCQYCNMIFKNISHSREHLVKQHLLKYHCHICDSVSHQYSNMKQHTSKHHLDKMVPNNFDTYVNKEWACSQCGKHLASRSSLRRHIGLIHEQILSRLHQCNICYKKFRSKELLVKHQTAHKQKYTCSIDQCQAVCASSLSLKKHKFDNHKDFLLKNKPFLCNMCGKGFLRETVLTAHLEWKHNIGQPQKCDICNKVFRGKVALSNHKASHKQHSVYQCEICGNSYKYRSSLYLHKKTSHSKVNTSTCNFTYCCEVCQKCFKTKRAFTHHLVSKGHATPNQTVNKEAIQQCPLCDKQFGIKDKLERHIAVVHLQERQYKCEKCGKSFGDKSNYHQHLKIHTGLKPYCDLCKKCFRSRIKLKAHMDNCHSSEARTVEQNSLENTLQSQPDLLPVQNCSNPTRQTLEVETEVLIDLDFVESGWGPKEGISENHPVEERGCVPALGQLNAINPQYGDSVERPPVHDTNMPSKQLTVLTAASVGGPFKLLPVSTQ